MKKTLILLLLLPAFAQAQNIITFAGSTATAYGGDGGAAAVAKINVPAGIIMDARGNLYIADQGNDRIRKIDASGTITTFAGLGFAAHTGDGGPASAAALFSPNALAIDAAGNIYVSEYDYGGVRKIDVSGTITTIAGSGSASFSGDNGPATDATMNQPTGVAVDAAGNVYIADMSNQRIRKVNTAGIITTIAGYGVSAFSGDGSAATLACMHQPTGVAVDATGNVYVADQINGRIRKINAAGIISTIAGNGTLGFAGDGGAAITAELYQPTGVTVDAAGNIFISDIINNRIRKINTSGIISTIAGDGIGGFAGDGGPATDAHLYRPNSVAVSAAGDVYIADMNNDRIRKVNTSNIISTIAGVDILGDGGPATAAELNEPTDVAFDAAGNVYICDLVNNRIRKVNTAGIITTVAGNGISGYNGDGIPATDASLNQPISIAVDTAGNLFISDVLNNRVRKVNRAGIISTVVGSGAFTFSSSSDGDGGPATDATLGDAQGIAVDIAGNLYIADGYSKIRKVNSAGIIYAVAGNGINGGTGDGGPATDAELGGPRGVSIDSAGNIYISDDGNTTIRKVDVSTGIINVAAGNGVTGELGDGGAATSAQLNYPYASVDAAGNIFIAEEDGQKVREVFATTGIIQTIAGDGTSGYSGDGGPAVAAELSGPVGAKANRYGDIYIVDAWNNVIRRINGPLTSLSAPGKTSVPHDVLIYPNPASTLLNIAASTTIDQVTITDLLGQTVFSHEYNQPRVQVHIADLPTGVYFVKINGSDVKKFVKE